MCRTVEGAGNVEAAMLAAVRARRDGGAPFVGCEVQAVTPLGQRIVRILEEEFGEYRLDKASSS